MSRSSWVCLCPSEVILFSLEHSRHLTHGVLRELQGCLRGVCLKFQECLEVSRVLTESFKGVSRKCKGYSKIEGHFKEF